MAYEIKCGTERACSECPFDEYLQPRTYFLGETALILCKFREIMKKEAPGVEIVERFANAVLVTTPEPMEVIDINQAVQRYFLGECTIEEGINNGKDF